MEFRIKKGFDVPLAGKPAIDVQDVTADPTVAVYPLEFEGLKQRLKVSEGDTVRRGDELMEDKGHVEFKLRAPASGRVTAVVRGARRFVEKIVIETDNSGTAASFCGFSAGELGSLSASDILDQLVTTGYLSLIRQRPFSRMADVKVRPRSIFVNAMSTGPFQADAETVVRDDPAAFQAGLDVLAHLTDGPVHLCLAVDAGDVLRDVRGVQVHTFSGPHPAGNTSVHIDRVDPMGPHDVVWCTKAVDLVQVGRLFLDGKLPESRVVALGGPGVKPAARRHYRVMIGGGLQSLFADALDAGPLRVINGDVLSGTTIEADAPHLRFHQSAITVIAEDCRRHFMGWTMPGFSMPSFSRLFASTWLRRGRRWSIGTNLNGEERALVLSGYYDRVMPLNIMVDFLIRAVLAGDTDEAIALGILETAPEDFALCDYVCPSKLEFQKLIHDGLTRIEEEGI